MSVLVLQELISVYLNVERIFINSYCYSKHMQQELLRKYNGEWKLVEYHLYS